MRRYLARLSGASVSPVAEFALRFVRTIILSHVLAPEDVGAAVALVAILTSCEVVADIGLDKFVFVNTGENRAQAVAAAQQIVVTRAVVMTIVIALFAPALAAIFGASDHVGTIRWLGAVPLVRSFRNWRVVQIQQEYRYGPEAIANIAGQLGAVVAVIPAAFWFQDERALLASLVVEAGLYVILSHLLEPRVRVGSVDPAMRRAALTFGLPLMVNGIGLMAMAQFDRAVVANLFSLSTLAIYSLALTLAIVPTSVLQRVVGNIGVPFLAGARGGPEVPRQAALIVVLACLIGGAAYAAGVGLFLDKLVPLFYGARYAISSTFCALAAAVAFLRIFRGSINIVLLAHSKTGWITAGNILGGIGLLIGFLLAYWSQRVEAVVLGTAIGDLLSLIALLAFARGHLRMGSVLIQGSLLVAIVGAAASEPLVLTPSGWGLRTLVFAAVIVVIGLDSVVLYRRVVVTFMRGRLRASDSPVLDKPQVANTLIHETEL
jgi:O-antigen/teichoic acid export membrane protein